MKKDKAILVSNPNSGEDSDEKQDPSFGVRFSSRNNSSKYDFVKVFISVINVIAEVGSLKN